VSTGFVLQKLCAKATISVMILFLQVLKESTETLAEL
jgi:hypothetical protein